MIPLMRQSNSLNILRTMKEWGKEPPFIPQQMGLSDLHSVQSAAKVPEDKEAFPRAYDESPPEEADYIDTCTAMVPRTDDPDAPALTWRAMAIGTTFALLMSFVNTVLSFRTNGFQLSSTLAVLLAYPVGIFLSSILPGHKTPFSIKEHVLVGIIAGAASSTPYGLDNVIVQKFRLFINNSSISFWESLAWCLITQFLGFGIGIYVNYVNKLSLSIAGLTRDFLVKPREMLFPSSLSNVSLYITLHKPDSSVGKWKMNRYQFFWIAFGVIFVYTWIPEFIAPSLQLVSVVCLLGGENKILQFLGSGGPYAGVGLFGLTFDWYYIQTWAITTPFRYAAGK